MNPYGQGGYVIMHLRRTMEATATTTDLITTARTKAALRPTEIPTIMATTILTISRTSPARATTTTDRAEDTAITTTTTTALTIAALASLGPAAPAASSKCASDEVISHQSLIKHQPVSNRAHRIGGADPCGVLPAQLPLLRLYCSDSD